jgi:glycyl-tRNA synthetase
MASQTTLDAILSLSKRKGFVYQSSEIYGGLNGCWDFGPLGVELLRNIKDSWWKAMTYRSDIVGIDSSILMHPRVWEASGHVGQFSDPMIDNKTSKSRHRADNLIEDFIFRLRNKVSSSRPIRKHDFVQCTGGIVHAMRESRLFFASR